MTNDTMNTPLGPVTVSATASGISSVWLGDTSGSPTVARASNSHSDTADGDGTRRLAAARAQLEEYFAGERTAFEVPLDLRGTPFQLAVWNALLEIPFGVTCSYGELARRIGKPRAVRAVGHAIGSNPVAIVVPCHRVIGARGRLTGYAGGIERKAWLLAHEGCAVA
jgi:methylated-DNA-[protein]-cysteine S-methyltransferase